MLPRLDKADEVLAYGVHPSVAYAQAVLAKMPAKTGSSVDGWAALVQADGPIYRNHVIAQVKPATRTRIDLGFALKERPPSGRLVATGGFSKRDRITHRIPISSASEIDEEVRFWLTAAYELDG